MAINLGEMSNITKAMSDICYLYDEDKISYDTAIAQLRLLYVDFNQHSDELLILPKPENMLEGRWNPGYEIPTDEDH